MIPRQPTVDDLRAHELEQLPRLLEELRQPEVVPWRGGYPQALAMTMNEAEDDEREVA